MSSDGLFLRAGDQLTVMRETQYDTEAVLQEALARFPDVLAGPTTDGASSHLLLIRREMPVPVSAGSSGLFALDHLFVDSDAVPVLVEVKRSSDTRIRREVIGQMVDYAANAITYWPLSTLQDALERTAEGTHKSADELIGTVWSGEVEDFWRSVEANLRAGRVRLVFVADRLPVELVRAIEFLNAQMNPAEVLGVELHQYVGDGRIVYVPNVVGRTQAAIAKKTTANGQIWTEESFAASAVDRLNAVEQKFVEQLLQHARERGARLAWGKGASAAVTGWYLVGGRPTAIWWLTLGDTVTRPYLLIYAHDVQRYVDDGRVDRALEPLGQVPAMAGTIAAARASGWQKMPSVRLADIAGDTTAQEQVLGAITRLADVPA